MIVSGASLNVESKVPVETIDTFRPFNFVVNLQVKLTCNELMVR
jgi:hypothetical protein